MASLSADKNGNRFIQFFNENEHRKTLRLGKVSLRHARSVKHHVEELVSATITGCSIDSNTAHWLADLGEAMTNKLVNVGLIPKRNASTLGPFVRAYIEGRIDIKKSTREHLERVEKDLMGCFSANKPLREFTEGDGEKFRLYLIGQGLAENTVRRRCGRAKQFFTAAVRQRLIERSPFNGLKSNVQANHARFYFVTHEEIQRVLDVCLSTEWRLIVALSRYGGLRCPSETLALTWRDVNWDKKRIRITSPKTEHHSGCESRIIPLFPELRPHLEAAWDEVEPGAVYVITSYRDATQNLRSRLLDIIHWAGLKPWPKLFQNMRSTRETELAERFPMHVVCRWIGNSEPVAAKHYLQLTDEHFNQATDEKSAAYALQSLSARPCRNTSEGITSNQVVPNEKSRKVAPGKGLRLLAVSGRKSLHSKDLRKLPDEDSNLGQSG